MPRRALHPGALLTCISLVTGSCGGQTAQEAIDASDASGDALDVGLGDTMCFDVMGDVAMDATTLACATPVSSSMTFDAAPTFAMCGEFNGLGYSRWSCACGGYLAIFAGVGVDCTVAYFFDASTHAFVAKLHNCAGWICEEGPAEFVLPKGCCDERSCRGAGAVHHDVCPKS